MEPIDCDAVLKHIRHMWIEDCKTLNEIKRKESVNLDECALETPYVHSKYLNYFYDLRSFKIKLEHSLKILKKEKREYYKGQSDAKVYAAKPFNLKLKADDVQIYIESDEEYSNLVLQLSYVDNLIDYVKHILDQINKRSFLINAAINWVKITNGISG